MSGHSKWSNIQAKKGKADAALAASLFHYKEMEIRDLKKYLQEKNVPVRL